MTDSVVKEVTMLERMRYVDERVTPYATVTDFGEVFIEETHSLYLLSFLLTGDKDKAEQCFIEGLGECIEEVGTFMEWARLSARRTIIKQAVQMIRPVPAIHDDWSFNGVEGTLTASSKNNLLAAIVSLCGFERFVFVMSILEGLSDGDCLSLLRCSRREIQIARELALRYLAATDMRGDHDEEALDAWRVCLSSPR